MFCHTYLYTPVLSESDQLENGYLIVTINVDKHLIVLWGDY